MDEQNIALIIGILASAPGILAILWQMRKDRANKKTVIAERILKEEESEKVKAEAEDIAVRTALSLLEPLKTRISELETLLKDVTTRLNSVSLELATASGEIVRLNSALAEKDRRIEELENKEKLLLKTVDELKNEVRELRIALSKYEDK